MRVATLSDLPQILKINTEVQAFPWTRESLKSEMEGPHFSGWVILAQSKGREIIIGYIFIRRGAAGLNEAEIMSLGVAADHQRIGIGQKLIEEAMKNLSPGCSLFLEVSENNKGAVTLYKKIGFEVLNTRKAYYPDGSDALCMKLRIANP